MRNTLELSEMQTPRYSVKWTDFAVPLVPRLYKIHSIADAGRPHAQDCPAPLIDSPTGHYTNTGTHSYSLWLSFIPIVQQGRALEHAFIALNGTSTHCHAYRKYTGSLRSRTSLYSGHFRWHQWCPHYRGSTVHCIAVFKVRYH